MIYIFKRQDRVTSLENGFDAFAVSGNTKLRNALISNLQMQDSSYTVIHQKLTQSAGDTKF